MEVVASNECLIGAPTLLEVRVWCSMNLGGQPSRWLNDFLDAGEGEVDPFSRDMADIASSAFERFGRSRGHPARLNFGDCLADAVSSALKAPLLFKGGDFGLTDVLAHPASLRM